MPLLFIHSALSFGSVKSKCGVCVLCTSLLLHTNCFIPLRWLAVAVAAFDSSDFRTRKCSVVVVPILSHLSRHACDIIQSTIELLFGRKRQKHSHTRLDNIIVFDL